MSDKIRVDYQEVYARTTAIIAKLEDGIAHMEAKYDKATATLEGMDGKTNDALIRTLEFKRCKWTVTAETMKKLVTTMYDMAQRLEQRDALLAQQFANMQAPSFGGGLNTGNMTGGNNTLNNLGAAGANSALNMLGALTTGGVLGLVGAAAGKAGSIIANNPSLQFGLGGGGNMGTLHSGGISGAFGGLNSIGNFGANGLAGGNFPLGGGASLAGLQGGAGSQLQPGKVVGNAKLQMNGASFNPFSGLNGSFQGSHGLPNAAQFAQSAQGLSNNLMGSSFVMPNLQHNPFAWNSNNTAAHSGSVGGAGALQNMPGLGTFGQGGLAQFGGLTGAGAFGTARIANDFRNSLGARTNNVMSPGGLGAMGIGGMGIGGAMGGVKAQFNKPGAFGIGNKTGTLKGTANTRLPGSGRISTAGTGWRNSNSTAAAKTPTTGAATNRAFAAWGQQGGFPSAMDKLRAQQQAMQETMARMEEHEGIHRGRISNAVHGFAGNFVNAFKEFYQDVLQIIRHPVQTIINPRVGQVRDDLRNDPLGTVTGFVRDNVIQKVATIKPTVRVARHIATSTGMADNIGMKEAARANPAIRIARNVTQVGMDGLRAVRDGDWEELGAIAGGTFAERTLILAGLAAGKVVGGLGGASGNIAAGKPHTFGTARSTVQGVYVGQHGSHAGAFRVGRIGGGFMYAPQGGFRCTVLRFVQAGNQTSAAGGIPQLPRALPPMANAPVVSAVVPGLPGLGGGVPTVTSPSAAPNIPLASDARQVAISQNAAQTRVMELKTTLPSNRLPTTTSAAVDARTGNIFFGESGTISNNIHPILAERMPDPSLEFWVVSNCAEFNAVNNALHAGANLSDLTVTTLRIRTGAPMPRCLNCKITTDGVFATSD